MNTKSIPRFNSMIKEGSATWNFVAAATEQGIFDKVAVHLLNQGVKSMGGQYLGTCAYRGEGSTMCAAGCLIADEDYNPNMENKGWGIISNCQYEFMGPTLSANGELISALQLIHDNTEPAMWGHGLRALAGEHGLSTQVLDK